MKKIHIIIALTSTCTFANAQNKKYVETMEHNIAILDTTRDAAILQNEANAFERIGNAEKAEWLPNYYAAYCYVNMTYSTKADVDTWCDKAETFLHKADSLSPNNSEIITLKAQIASARISVNPMTRGQKYGTMAGELREQAKKIDATNPRPYYLDGTAFFYTPPMFGGGKDKAKPSFEKAKSLYETFKPASSIAPHWGAKSTEYFLKKCDEKEKDSKTDKADISKIKVGMKKEDVIKLLGAPNNISKTTISMGTTELLFYNNLKSSINIDVNGNVDFINDNK